EQELRASVEHAVNARVQTGDDAREVAAPGSDHAPAAREMRTATVPPSSTAAAPNALPTTSSSGAIALSSAGSLLLDAMNVPHQEQGPVIHVAHPLLAMPAQEPSLLAHAIEQAITRSGVFYESHVARWADNDFPASELAQEPQADWRGPSPASTAEPPTSQALVLPHADAPLLVRQQLEAHEQHRLVVITELWPGQRARIEFEEPGHTRDHADEDAPEHHDRAWSTRVDLTLESLGPVSAIISLRNDSIECRLSVASRDAQSRLSEARQDLDSALRRRSLELTQCSVTHER
ncbi:MAG TPA: flagellar hook-length control protein FliK, partial [Casimicrobiaceae bacterium]|nr:flagellar hook-length control protein FliK [Casimicrobiaceae bacterium]